MCYMFKDMLTDKDVKINLINNLEIKKRMITGRAKRNCITHSINNYVNNWILISCTLLTIWRWIRKQTIQYDELGGMCYGKTYSLE